MVADTEFREFLRALDGQHTWGDVFNRNTAWQASEKGLARQLRHLEERGLVESSEPASPQRQPEGLPPVPIESITVNLTRQCNLRCRFCYLLPLLGKANGKILSTEEIIAFLDRIRPHLSRRLLLSLLGGEPLLEPATVLALARHALRKRWECLVSTNGQLVTPGFARAARELGLHVQVSLDGPDAERHDFMRGAGAYAKTLAGIRRLTEAGVHVILSLVAHRDNLDSLEDYYRLAIELGVREARFIPLKRIGGARDGTLDPVALSTLMRYAAELFQRNPEFRRLAGRDAFSILAGTCRLSVRRSSCGAGRQTFLLDADGAIYPCLNLHAPEFRLGNIREAGFDFAETWRTSCVLDRVRCATWVEHAANACSGCAMRSWCLGGCHGESWSLCGELNSRAWDCADQQKSIVEMIWRLADSSAPVAAGRHLC